MTNLAYQADEYQQEGTPLTVEAFVGIEHPSSEMIARYCFDRIPSRFPVEGEGKYNYEKVFLEIYHYPEEGVSQEELWEEAHMVMQKAVAIWDTLRVLSVAVTYAPESETEGAALPFLWETNGDWKAAIEGYQKLESGFERRPNGLSRIRVYCLYGFALPGGWNVNVQVTETTQVVPTLETQLFGIYNLRRLVLDTGAMVGRDYSEVPVAAAAPKGQAAAAQAAQVDNTPIVAEFHEDVDEAPYGSIIDISIGNTSRYVSGNGDYISFYAVRRSGRIASGKATTAKINIKASGSMNQKNYQKAVQSGLLADIKHGESSTRKAILRVKKTLRTPNPRAANQFEPFAVFDLIEVFPAAE